MSKTREQLEEYLKTLHIKCDTVVDVGGSQKPISKRLGSLEASKVITVDLPEPHEILLKPDVEMDMNVQIIDYKTRGNVVFCLEVMEYIWNPVAAMENLYTFTYPGGILYVSFPFIYPVHNPKEQDMLRYTEFGARKLIEYTGFEIDNTFVRSAEPYWLNGFYQSEGMKPSKDYKNHNAVGFIFKCKKI